MSGQVFAVYVWCVSVLCFTFGSAASSGCIWLLLRGDLCSLIVDGVWVGSNELSVLV